MLQQVKYIDTEFTKNNIKKRIELKVINSDVIIDLENKKRIITVKYGTDIIELLLSVKSFDGARLKFRIISTNNCIKKSGIVETGDRLFINVNNTMITTEYMIKTQIELNAEDFNSMYNVKIKNNNFLLKIDEFKERTEIGTSEYIDVVGNVKVKGNLPDTDKIVDLKNLVIHGRLVIDIGNGHINLKNVKTDNISILSAGERSVVFRNGSSTNRITVTNKKPTHIKIEENAHVNIGSIYLNPCGNTLEASRVRMSGNFDNTIIMTQSPLILEGGSAFRVNTPILVQNKNPSDEISFAGNFNNVNRVLVRRPVKIMGNKKKPPRKLRIEIAPDNFYEPVEIEGDFSNTDLYVTKKSYIKCRAKMHKLNVEPQVERVVMQAFEGTLIDDPQISDLVEIEGDRDVVNKIVNDAQLHGSGEIVILGVLKPVDFTDGIGDAVRKVSRVGKYNLIVKVKEKDGLVVLEQKLPITVIP